MAELKVFVSSTCYDLAIIREQLKKYIEKMGYKSILSDYSDVLYDPREHTHTSCIEEIKNIDILILIIGSRYGGKAVPAALKKINSEKLKEYSTKSDIFENAEELSITQLEVLKAIENQIPIYVFVDEKVSHDHHVYQKNKDIIDTMVFPSIDKQESAKYIFSFIDFLSHRLHNNNIMKYKKLDDIEEQLKKQWSAYFQRLLNEQRTLEFESKNYISLSEQISDLREAMLSTLTDNNAKEIARSTVEFRRLIDVIVSLGVTKQNILKDTNSFINILKSVNIKFLIELDEKRIRRDNYIFVTKDKNIIESRMSLNFLLNIEKDWNRFLDLKQEHRSIIYDTLSDNHHHSPMPLFRVVHKGLKEYLKDKYEESQIINIKKSMKKIEYYFK